MPTVNQPVIVQQPYIANGQSPSNARQPFTYNNSVMRFEPVSAFLFGKQNLSEQANHLREKKEEYINNAAVHFWINKDAIANLERLILETNKIINLIEKELKK